MFAFRANEIWKKIIVNAKANMIIFANFATTSLKHVKTSYIDKSNVIILTKSAQLGQVWPIFLAKLVWTNEAKICHLINSNMIQPSPIGWLGQLPVSLGSTKKINKKRNSLKPWSPSHKHTPYPRETMAISNQIHQPMLYGNRSLEIWHLVIRLLSQVANPSTCEELEHTLGDKKIS